jgi:hypothetical protein
MRWLFSRRWFKIAAALLVLLAAALLGCASYFRVLTWRDVKVYRAMSRECHPVWQDLHWGRIQPGQAVETVIAQTKPLRVHRFTNFTELSYQEGLSFTGVTIIARDGKLVAAAAWSCTWHRVFFDALSLEEWRVYKAARYADLDARLGKEKAGSK